MAPRLPDDVPHLPSFDARNFEPPAWAKRKYDRRNDVPPSAALAGDSSGPDDDAPIPKDQERLGSDLEAGVEPDTTDTVRFTTAELKNLLNRGLALKDSGNKLYTASPQRLSESRESYLAAIDTLPDCPRPEKASSDVVQSGLVEVTEEEAEQIEAQRSKSRDMEREDVEASIRECTKAVWGNLAAVYLAENNFKEAVDACNSALEIDPGYIKGIHRRAQANDRLGSWSALSAAQEDYKHLLDVLPKNSPQLPIVKKALASLPARIATQQEKEKNEMMEKLKELGNGLLGKFGLSTDMFKFDQQAGGGYNMRFQR